MASVACGWATIHQREIYTVVRVVKPTVFRIATNSVVATPWRELEGCMESELISAVVTKAAPGGAMLPGHRWRVQLADGRLMWAVITARVHTLKIPTLQVGQSVSVRLHTSDDETCSVDIGSSPVEWVGPKKLERMAAQQ